MSVQYRLLSFNNEAGHARPGILVGERVVPVADVLGEGGEMNTTSVYGLLQNWDEAHARLQAAAESVGPKHGQALADVELLAPILNPGTSYFPGTLFCAGSNYWDHKEEMAEILFRTSGMRPDMTKPAEP